MATQESLDRVQQLYVAYYGRPADQAGQEYWADRLDAEGEGAIINAFGNSAEYDQISEGQGFGARVDAIYQQAFGRAAEPDGLAYWVGVLERGEKSLAEIATTIINAASGQDRLVLNARVEAAADYTAEFGAADTYDVDAAKAAIEAAKAGVDASALTEALTALSAAQDSVESFLEGARSNEFLKENQDVKSDTELDANPEGTSTGVRLAIEEELTDSINEGTINPTTTGGTDGDSLADVVGDTSLKDRSVTVQDALIADAVEEAAENLSDFQGVIAEVNGLSLAIRNYNNAVTAEAAAQKTLDSAEADTDGAVTTFTTLDNTIDTVYFSDTAGTVTGGADQVEITGAGTGLITDVVEVRAADGEGTLLMTIENGEFVIESGQEEVAGIAALRNALQAEYDAQVAYDKADDNLDGTDGAIAALTDFDSEITVEDFGKNSADTDITTGLLAAQHLAELQGTVEGLDEAIARFENARDLATELEGLDKAVSDATDAITDSEEDGGLDVNLITDYSAPSADDDVFLFSESDTAVTIGNFGASGEDRIFFGEDYALVQLDGEWDASADTGDASALEVFWEQNGSNLTLYVESKAFAGNASGVDDITQITLTGVSANDIDFSAGYLTNGEPA